jgi:hypothetical protein
MNVKIVWTLLLILVSKTVFPTRGDLTILIAAAIVVLIAIARTAILMTIAPGD